MDNKLTLTDGYALFLATLMWALSFPFIKIGLEYYPPIMLGAIRYFLGSNPIVLFLMLKKDSLEVTKNLFKNHWKYILSVGIFMVAIPNIAQNIGMMYTSASLSTLIQTVGPIFTIVMAILILKESTNVTKISGTVLAFACTILLVFNQGIDFKGNNMLLIGNILQLVTAISYGTNALISKTVIHKISPFALVGWGMFVGSLLLFPISLVSESQGWVADLNVQALWAMVFLAIFPAFIATSLWYWVLERYELSKQMVFIYIMPFYAIIFSYILLDEKISIMALILGVLTILGVAIAQRNSSNKSKIQEPGAAIYRC